MKPSLLRAVCLALAWFVAMPACGQSLDRAVSKRSWKKQWIVSIAALAAATALDSVSSMGRSELNPLLRNAQGTFSTGRGIAIKSAGTAAMVAIQTLYVRKYPAAYKTGALLNLGSAAAFAASATHNLQVNRVSQ